MSRFTYFLKMNSSSLCTLSELGGNVDLNIKNMPNVFKGVIQKLGLTVDQNRLEAIDRITERYEELLNNLEKLGTMKTGYIKDLADGAQKYLSKRVLNFYTDLYKLVDTQSETQIDNLFKVYMYMDTMKVVIDGALDLTDAIYTMSYKRQPDNESESTVVLNDTVGHAPVVMDNNTNKVLTPDDLKLNGSSVDTVNNSVGVEPFSDTEMDDIPEAPNGNIKSH